MPEYSAVNGECELSRDLSRPEQMMFVKQLAPPCPKSTSLVFRSERGVGQGTVPRICYIIAEQQTSTEGRKPVDSTTFRDLAVFWTRWVGISNELDAPGIVVAPEGRDQYLPINRDGHIWNRSQEVLFATPAVIPRGPRAIETADIGRNWDAWLSTVRKSQWHSTRISF